MARPSGLSGRTTKVRIRRGLVGIVSLFLTVSLNTAACLRDARAQTNDSPPNTPTPVTERTLNAQAVPYVSGLKDLTCFVPSATDSETIYLCERAGIVRVIKSGKLTRSYFLDIEDYVDAKGLQGIAFPKDFASSRRLFVNYTDKQGDLVIASFKADEDEIDPETIYVRMKIVQPFGTNNSSEIGFGPDGYLYVGIADAVTAQGATSSAQDTKSLVGKILRLNVSAAEGYTVPSDNPFADGKGNAPEIWASGFRKPGKFSFDPTDGSLFSSDVGNASVSEVNRVGRGGNFGWNIRAGTACLPDKDCSTQKFDDPIFVQSSAGSQTFSNGFLYRGALFPQLKGAYIFGARDGRDLWVLEKSSPGVWTRSPLLSVSENIAILGEDSQGEIYILSTEGNVLRVSPR